MPFVGAAIMDTERMLHTSSSSGGGHSTHQLNTSMDHSPGSQAPPPPVPASGGPIYPPIIARKKKSDRIIAPQLNLSEAGFINGNQSPYGAQINHYSNDSVALGSQLPGANSTPMALPNGGPAGIMNHGFAQDQAGNIVNGSSMLSPPPPAAVGASGELGPNLPRLAAAGEDGDSDDRQEVIEVQILPQDDNWGENTTNMAGPGNTSDMDLGHNGHSHSITGMGTFLGETGEENDLNKTGGSKAHLLDTERGMGFRCRRHALNLLTGLLTMIAFFSPALMVILPSMGTLELRDSQLLCGVECSGMLVVLGFKELILAVGVWAVFVRTSRATLPRLHIFRAVVAVLVIIFLASFWLFYISHLLNDRETVKYSGLVQYAVSLIDSLLFVHYLAVLLIELRHRNPQFYVKVVRSPDGESRGFPIGQMSVQRAAAWVLDQYYTEFPIYNPYLAGSGGGRGPVRPKGQIKMYDVDGIGGPLNDGNSTVVSVASNLKRGAASSHNDRFYEEYEHERKVKKRRARLVTAAEDAFTHIKRIRENQIVSDKAPMGAYDAAQAIFPTLSRPLQKYLRVTRQQPRHTMEAILQHLSTCLSFDMSPRAFLEKYLVEAPVLQSDRERRDIQNWSVVSERSLYRELQPGVIFQLRQGDISLLCQVQNLPHLSMSEEIIEPGSNRFVLRINSETSV